MSSSKRLIPLRNAIDDLVNSAFAQGQGASLSTDKILAQVKRQLPMQIQSAEADLKDIALKRLIDDVSRRKAGRHSTHKSKNLFGEYPSIPQIVIVGSGKRKRTSDLTIREAIAYLESHSPRAISEKHEAFKRLVEHCMAVRGSDDETLQQLVERRKSLIVGEPSGIFAWSGSTKPGDATRGDNAEFNLA